jgi:Undecaprenyl-phosphate galactose phosphotransferase WbaP
VARSSCSTHQQRTIESGAATMFVNKSSVLPESAQTDHVNVTNVKSRRGVVAAALVATDGLVLSLMGSLILASGRMFSSAPTLTDPLHSLDPGPSWRIWILVLAIGGLLLYFHVLGHYTGRVPFWSQLPAVVGATAVAATTYTLVTITGSEPQTDAAALFVWSLLIPTLLLGRQAMREVLSACGWWRLRTIIIGEASAIASARSVLEGERALGYHIIGSLTLQEIDNPDQSGTWLDILRSQGAQFVVLALGTTHSSKQDIIALTLARTKFMFGVVPPFNGLPVVGFNQQYFFSHDTLLLMPKGNITRPVSRFVKVAGDKLAAGLLLLLLSPLFLVVASIVRADGGPAFFGHRRIGANGRSFRCLKFRTMVPNAEEVLLQVLKADPTARIEWAETQKLRDDPRITPIGDFLRRTSLDELPQLVNVLRGEMSLVGPRPIVEAEVVRYGRNIDHYYQARPGMTGLWQVSGRSDTSYQRRVQLDCWYVKNWTLWHDVMILLKTIPAVLKKDGAL